MSSSGDSTPIATPNDVRSRVNFAEEDPEGGEASGISNSEIQTYLEDATFELDQVTDLGSMDDELRRRLEWRLAAIQILSIRQGSRAYHQQSLGSMSRSYEAKMIDRLQEWCERHGPDGLFDDNDFWAASIQG